MKKISFLGIIALLSLYIYYSCSNETLTDSYTEENFSVAKYKAFFKNLSGSQVTFLEGKDLKTGYTPHFDSKNLKTTSNINGVYFTYTSENKVNLNELLDHPDSDIELLGLVNYYQRSDSTVIGISNFLYSKSQKKFYVNTYKVLSGSTQLCPGYPKIVNNIYFDNIMFTQNTLFSGSDISLVGVDVFTRTLKYDYDDMYLEQKLVTFKNNNWAMSTSYNDPELSYSGSDSGVCSAVLPQCQSGSGPRCTQYYCAKICPFSSLTQSYDDFSLDSYYSELSSNLTDALLYDFRDEMKKTNIGNQMNCLYYIIGDHFKSSYDSSMLIDMANMSLDLRVSINNFKQKRDDVEIISHNLSQKMQSLLQKSINNSISSDYIQAATMIKNKINDCESKNYSQLLTVLN